MDQEPVDIKKLRYVLYARKSTEDENRQVRSIGDQIRDCQKLAETLGLHVVGKPIKETKSAKKPHQRPLFTKMLEDLKNKKYDGILCWLPDRLCRNMLEGGQIIDMLDNGTLKDIRFHSHQFSNDANGKMLLGMLFVFSKQYSDDLSAKVTRGVRGNFSEGKSSGTPKFGYTRDKITGLYEPNEHFELVQEAWQMRVAGDTVESISKHLLDKGYHRKTKAGKKILPKTSKTAKMFKDSFYYGVLVQKDQTVDLRTIYDFKPMIDEEDYNLVQELGYGRSKRKAGTNTAFYPLSRFVFCAVCNSSKHMMVGKNRTGGGLHVLTYRCDNSECTRSPKSLRAKHIFSSVNERLKKFELTDQAYSRYSKQIDSMTDVKIVDIKQEIQSLRGALRHVVNDITVRANNMGKMSPESDVFKANEMIISDQSVKRADIEHDIQKKEAKIANPSQIKLTKEEFLNLIITASDKMKAGSAVEKDALCRILLLNLRVDNEKVVDYIWREPFASLVKAIELSPGGDGRI